MKKRTLIFAASLSLFTLTPPSYAWPVVCVNCGTEWTQLMNQVQLVNQYAEQVRHTINQVKMIQDDFTNTQALLKGDWGNTFDQINKLSELANRGNSLAYSASDLTERMNRTYQGYEAWQRDITPQEYSQNYKALSGSLDDSAQGALYVANGLHQQRREDEQLLSSLESSSQSATGRMAAIQAGNQISAQIVRQLQKVETLMSSQIQMTAAFIQTENERQAVQKAQSEQFQQFNIPPLKSRELEHGNLHDFGY